MNDDNEEFLNYISLGGVTIGSKNVSLEELKKVLIELLDKYQNFLLLKKETDTKCQNNGGYLA